MTETGRIRAIVSGMLPRSVIEYDLAVIPGDGIGLAVTEAVLGVLDRVTNHNGVTLSRTRYGWAAIGT